jgi:bacteriorhodopsin
MDIGYCCYWIRDIQTAKKQKSQHILTRNVMLSFSVQQTTDLSIWIQVLTGIVSFQGVFYKLKPEDAILTDVLKLETFVQFVELIFYIFVLRKMAQTVSGMATARYYDWFITTPTMLITTIMYMKYEDLRQNQDKTPLQFSKFLHENKENISKIVLSNFLMLLCGYLGEKGTLDILTATILGFAFFTHVFYIVYKEYASKSVIGKKLYNLLVFVWGMYGVAFLLPSTQKNNSYNILDLFAKNFFGLFLYFKAKQLANQ